MSRAQEALEAGPPTTSDVLRFFSCIRIEPNGCVVWTGTRIETGYGVFKVGGTQVLAHRFAYALLRGALLEDHEVPHCCKNPACVVHLELVSPEVHDAIHGARGFCKAGHLMIGSNVYENAKTGRRHCRTCERKWERKRNRERRRARQRLDYARKKQDPAWIEKERARNRARYARKKAQAG